MSELLPCPFCGGEATVTEFNHGCIVSCENDAKAWINGKDDVDGHLAHIQSRSKAEAIAAWNARTDDYERAAEYWQRMYEQTFSERTCHDTGENEWHFVCSACGYEQNGYECWNYCPNCGCKVIGG